MKDFWNQVFQGFETIILAEFAKEYIVRDAASLRMHFGKRISKVVFIWLGYMRRVRVLRPSGVPEDEYYDMRWLCTMRRRASHFLLLIVSR